MISKHRWSCVFIRSIVARGVCAFILCLFCAIEMQGQVNTGTLSGQVTDSTGAVIPTATLKITDDSNGYTRQVQTSGDGNYVFPDLPIGRYTVTVEASG